MSENTNTFMTIPSTADFTRSASRRGRNVKSQQSVVNKAAYFDAMIAAMKDGKSEADAITHAEGVVQAIENELKLAAVFNEPTVPDKSAAQSGQTNDVIDESADETDAQLDDDNNSGQKSKSAFDKLQSALLKISAFSSFKKKDNVDIKEIRVLHKKLDFTVDQYDSIMDRVFEDMEFHMENLFYEKMLEAEAKFNGKLRLQYETLRSHVKCDAQIDNLIKETAILKQEMKEVITKNSQISSEIKDLRIFKSNAEVGERLMSEKLAKRKNYIKVLTNKVKKLQESIALKTANTQEDQTCHESYPSENELTEHEEEVEEIENNAAEETSSVIWYMNAQTRRPKWNTSRKTNLLNRDSFSIMHDIEYQDDDMIKETRGMTEEDRYHKIDRKYRTLISGLKFQLESERKEARKIAAINAKRNHKMKKIIDVLKECLAVLHDDQKDTQATLTISDTKSCSSISSRRREVEAIFERKELLENLINGLHGQNIEFDYYSSTDKEDSQIYRDSRPSSVGVTSTKISAPIVPIQLKSENKLKKKSNEFNSVKGWVIAARNKTAPIHPGIMAVSLIESAIKTEHEKSNSEKVFKTSRKAEVESIMRRQRPVSARTNISQNSVRFAPTLEDTSSNTTLKRPKRTMTPVT